MSDQHDTIPEPHGEILGEYLGPDNFGFPEIPRPHEWPSEYGLDEATAIAVVPERALIFWELATLLESGLDVTCEFRLVRMKLHGEEPTHEKDWPIEPVGRFQDSGLEPGKEYIWIIARNDTDGMEPLMVTNPVRMPIRSTLSEVQEDLPSSIELPKRLHSKQ